MLNKMLSLLYIELLCSPLCLDPVSLVKETKKILRNIYTLIKSIIECMNEYTFRRKMSIEKDVDFEESTETTRCCCVGKKMDIQGAVRHRGAAQSSRQYSC